MNCHLLIPDGRHRPILCWVKEKGEFDSLVIYSFISSAYSSELKSIKNFMLTRKDNHSTVHGQSGFMFVLTL